MSEVELVCLANSRKRSGRCVAGIRTDDGSWVRLVGDGGDGELPFPDYTVDAGGPALPFDMVRVFLGSHRPKPHQPENWRVGPGPFRLVRRPASPEVVGQLRGALVRGPGLLGDTAPPIEVEDFDVRAARSSLALVVPENLRWVIRKTDEGKRQARVLFSLRRAEYDLPLTDPLWEQRLAIRPEGCYPASEAGNLDPRHVLLTVSLGEPYNGHCYKLAAAVMEVPPELRIGRA